MTTHNPFEQNHGRYGAFGGIYIPELLMAPIHDLIIIWEKMKFNQSFRDTLAKLLKNYAGRPTPLTEVTLFSEAIHGPRVFLKREDLLHTGAHKLNNALGQCLLAKTMGKRRIIAETGAGQHGVATAAACAHLGLRCVIYMGSEDMKRQKPNVARIRLIGAQVIPVKNGSATLKEAINEAFHDWSESFDETYYCLGSVLGPHPYPDMVATFQSVIGEECKKQFWKLGKSQPDLIIASVGGGSNAIGIFSAFLSNNNITAFFQEAYLAGIDGILIVDCPLEESSDFYQQCLNYHMAPINIIAPSTPPSRMGLIDQYGKGFLYYACRKGTTGMHSGLPDDFFKKIQFIKSHVHAPILAGFGISTRSVAKKVLKHADGVVVGSLFVKALEDGMKSSELTSLAASINPLN